MINVKGINRKNKHHVQYSDLPSTIRLIPYGTDAVEAGEDGYKPEETIQPVILTHRELNELTRDMNLSKEVCSPTGFTSQRKISFGAKKTFYLY